MAPRHFSDPEREAIRERLLRAGRDAFARVGVRKTTVDELARSAGVAKGSFYAFFASKELLFFAILEQDERRLRDTFLADALGEGPTKPESIRRFIADGLQLMRTDPFLRRVYEREEYDYLLRRLPPDVLANHARGDTDWLAGVVRRWQADGYATDIEAEVLAGAITLLIGASLNTDLVAPEVYDRSLALLVEMTADGIAGRR